MLHQRLEHRLRRVSVLLYMMMVGVVGRHCTCVRTVAVMRTSIERPMAFIIASIDEHKSLI